MTAPCYPKAAASRFCCRHLPFPETLSFASSRHFVSMRQMPGSNVPGTRAHCKSAPLPETLLFDAETYHLNEASIGLSWLRSFPTIVTVLSRLYCRRASPPGTLSFNAGTCDNEASIRRREVGSSEALSLMPLLLQLPPEAL